MINWEADLSNEPCFIIGAGPSLLDRNLSLIQDYLSVGINRVYFCFLPMILFFQDNDIYTEAEETIKELDCIKISSYQNDHKFNIFNPQPFTGKNAKNEFIIGQKGEIVFNKASLCMVMQFIYQWQCNPIILLGCDCKYLNGMTNFYGQNKKHYKKTLPNCIKCLQSIKDRITDRIIISCSDNDIFEQTELLEVCSTLPASKGRSYYRERILL